jgi:hypothetical protein
MYENPNKVKRDKKSRLMQLKEKSQIVNLDSCHLAKRPISASPMLNKNAKSKERDQANKKKDKKRGSKKKRFKEW